MAASGLPLAALVSWVLAGAREESWPGFIRRTADRHALALTLLVAFGVQFEDAHGITTDGVIYFSQLRSVLFDHDLNVAAEFEYLGQPPRPYHVVPIGPTPVWLPLYGLVSIVDAVGRALGFWPAPSNPVAIGLTLPYVRAALVSSFAIGVIGLWQIHRHLRDEFGQGVAFATSVLVFAATPLVWYMVYEPSMTHAASFGFVAIFVVFAIAVTSVGMTRRDCLILGVLIGLAFISRPQEALFALFPAILLLTRPEVPLAARFRSATRLAGWALVGASPFLALQAIHSAILFSREPFSLVGANGYLDLLQSRWADTLWSSWHGFLSWTPIAYVGLVGVLAYARRNWRWAVSALVILLLMAWLNGSTADWAAGWSFGGRRFISCLVLLAPGIAFVLWQLTRRPMVTVAILAVAVVGWNQLLMAQYAANRLPVGEPVSFGRIVRQQFQLLTGRWFVYPFAFPANVWFAWRTGLPIDRYDLLGPETMRPELDLPFDASASRFLMDGWGPRASDAGGDLRWTTGPRSEIVLPLTETDRPTRLVIHARTRLLEPPVRTTLRVLVNGREVGQLTPETERPSVSTIDVPTDVLIDGFNRLVFESALGAPPVAIYRVELRGVRGSEVPRFMIPTLEPSNLRTPEPRTPTLSSSCR